MKMKRNSAILLALFYVLSPLTAGNLEKGGMNFSIQTTESSVLSKNQNAFTEGNVTKSVKKKTGNLKSKISDYKYYILIFLIIIALLVGGFFFRMKKK